MKQTEMVLNHFKNISRFITPAEALEKYNIWRLADVMYKLRTEHEWVNHPQGKARSAKYEYLGERG